MRTSALLRWITLLALVWPIASHGQNLSLQKIDRLYLDDVDAGVGGERVVDLYLRAVTRHGDPIDHLQPVDLEVRDNGVRVDPAEVTLAQLSDAKRGISVVLAIDASRTMLGPPFERAKQAAQQFFDLLGDFDKVAVVSFAESAEVAASFSDARAYARVQLGDLAVNENALSTSFYDGVYQAVEQIRLGKDLPSRAAVIVFSDGKDGNSSRELDEVIEFARESRVLIYTIGYFRFGGGGFEVLRRISSDTGAQFQDASNSTDLAPFFNTIWKRMLRSYVLRFPADMDGEIHTLEIASEEVNDEQKVTYPDISAPLWPWLVGAGAGVFVLLIVLLIARARSPGKLVFEDGPRRGDAFTLHRGTVRVGSLDTNDLVIPSETVSRRHAEILVSGNGIEIKDLQSQNGTQVNGVEVRTSTRLQPGDRISIAEVHLVFDA